MLLAHLSLGKFMRAGTFSILSGILFITFELCSSLGFGVPKTSILLDETRAALALPLENRIQVLEKQGEGGYQNLVAIMFDEKAAMDLRWRAVTAAGRTGHDQAIPELELALKSKEWFLRNAALVSMIGIDQQIAARWARGLLSDQALVVRTAAVQAIGVIKDVDSRSLLWTKLYAKENYKGDQGLLIRRHILSTLAKLESRGSEKKFIEVLNDTDDSLHPIAINALEKITQKPLGKPTDSISTKRAHWLAWATAVQVE
jgi:hypothetical protein